MIKAEAVYKNQGKGDPKFDHFKLTVGNVVYEPIPIYMLRISELPTLEALLVQAAATGRAEAEAAARLAEQQRGVERYNRANEALLANERWNRRW